MANSLEPLWETYNSLLPKDPWTVTDQTVFLVALPHLLVIFLAYLLFSPAPTGFIRKSLALPFAFLVLYGGHMFRYAGLEMKERNKGLAIQAVYWTMKALELGFREQRPRWIGWEGKEEESEKTSRETVEQESRVARLKKALGYCYSYRAIGWSTGPSKSRFHHSLANIPEERWKIIRNCLWEVFRTYMMMDAALGLWMYHPYFRFVETAPYGSIYTPLRLPLGSKFDVRLPAIVSAAVLAFHMAVCVWIVQAFPAALLGVVQAALSRKPRIAALHYPLLFDRFWDATSLKEIWGNRWHHMYRSTFLFLGYKPGRKLGGRFGGVFSTFLVSGLLHMLGYISPDPLDRMLAKRMLYFFLLNALFITAEDIFEQMTGRLVGGRWGRLWTWSVLITIGIPLTDTWLKTGGVAGMGVDNRLDSMPFGTPVRSTAAWATTFFLNR